MTEIAIVKNLSIGTGYTHGKNAVILDVEIDDPEDLQTVEYFTPSGFSTLPQIGDQVIIHQISPEFKVATATNSGINIPTEQGESSIFSLEGTTVKASAKFKKNGEIVLNDNEGYAVEYESLAEKLNELYIHVEKIATAAGIPVLTPLWDIESAKVEKVRL